MARRRAKQKPPPLRLILDSGAVLALARNDQRARAELTAAREAGAEVVVPAVVVAETVRGNGPRDAPVNRVLRAVGESAPMTDAMARVAGALLGQAKSSDTIDALVVAECIQRGGGVVLTSDELDLSRLAAQRPEVVVRAI